MQGQAVVVPEISTGSPIRIRNKEMSKPEI